MDEYESARVLGLGVGLFILILIWSFTISGLLLFSRIDSPQEIFSVLIVNIFIFHRFLSPKILPEFELGTREGEKKKIFSAMTKSLHIC